jgi:3-phosphoshikimate 1-carboxyvinyltransferase
MGADINSVASSDGRGERIGEITVSGGKLTGIEISGDLVANIIDELPILAVTAALAGGTTVIRDAGELRVKETDRIAAVAKNLQAMGAQIEEFDDGMTIYGGRLLHGAAIDSYGDHRIAMAFAIAGLFADGETIIRDAECIAVSYPGFDRDLQLLSGEKTTA